MPNGVGCWAGQKTREKNKENKNIHTDTHIILLTAAQCQDTSTTENHLTGTNFNHSSWLQNTSLYVSLLGPQPPRCSTRDMIHIAHNKKQKTITTRNLANHQQMPHPCSSSRTLATSSAPASHATCSKPLLITVKVFSRAPCFSTSSRKTSTFPGMASSPPDQQRAKQNTHTNKNRERHKTTGTNQLVAADSMFSDTSPNEYAR